MWRINWRKRPRIASSEGFVIVKFQESFIETLRRAQAEAAQHDADPFRKRVEEIVRGMDAISTFALLDLLGLPKTTGNGRRIAQTMRSLGLFIPIKSRRLMPGGYRDTVTRGWTRPVRESRSRTSFKQGDTVGTSHLNSPMHSGTN